MKLHRFNGLNWSPVVSFYAPPDEGGAGAGGGGGTGGGTGEGAGGGGTGEGGGAGVDAGTGGDGKKKVEFSAEQQAYIDNLAQGIFAKARRQMEDEFTDREKKRQQDLEELERRRKEEADAQAEAARKEEQNRLKRGEHEQVIGELKQKLEKTEAEKARLETSEREKTMERIRLMRAEGAVDRAVDAQVIWSDARKDVEGLFQGQVRIDLETNEAYAVDDDGAPFRDAASGRRLTVYEAFREWLKKRPYLQRISGKEGGGSGARDNGSPDAGDRGTAAEEAGGVKPEIKDGKLFFKRSMMRFPDGSPNTAFIDKYREEIARATAEGRYVDDVGQKAA